jgi:CheY-like chemotaxis protein
MQSINNSKTYTVLYIEDDGANRQLVQFILERKDYLSLICAVDGKSGILAAKTQLPDIILLDISLPDIDGYAVLADLKQDPATQNIPVIAVSGDCLSKPSKNSPFSFDKFLTKPIEVEPLYKTIDEFLQLRP